MQPKARHIHVGNRGGGVKGRQNPQFADMLRVHAARVVLFEKPFQPPVANSLYLPVP